MKQDFEELFSKALATLIEQNGGSIETALDDMGIQDERDREPIKEWFGWDKDEDIDDEEIPAECYLNYRIKGETDKEIEANIKQHLEEQYLCEVKSFRYDLDSVSTHIYDIVFNEDHRFYCVDVIDENDDCYECFRIMAKNYGEAEEIVNNITCELTTNGAFNDIEVYTDDPEQGKILLTTMSQIGDAEFEEDNLNFMDGLRFELEEEEEEDY